MSAARPLPLADLARATGTEIDRVADLLLNVEREVLGQITEGTAGPGSTGEVQQIDLVMQILRDLARLMAHVSAALPPDLSLDAEVAAAGLTLERLRRSLLAHPPRTSPLAEPTIEMF